MKSSFKSIQLLVATAALGGLATFAAASPEPKTWTAAKPVTTFSEAKAVGPADTVTMHCLSCKTVMVRNSKHVGPPSKGSETWYTVGSKHTCSECGGEITVVKGKTADSMQHNCSKCGEGAVTCCAAPAPESKK